MTLRALRESAGVTQTELAERLGTTQSAIARMEGAGDLRISTLARYAAGLGLGIRIFATSDGERVAVVRFDVLDVPAPDE